MNGISVKRKQFNTNVGGEQCTAICAVKRNILEALLWRRGLEVKEKCLCFVYRSGFHKNKLGHYISSMGVAKLFLC